MSFSSDQKSEIVSLVMKSACCRRAFMHGALFGAGLNDGSVTLSLDSDNTVAFMSSLIKEIYSKEPERVSSPKGGRRRMIAFESKSAEKYVQSVLDGDFSFKIGCAMCESAFLRGLFLVCGRVSDPAKQYSLEFSLGEATDSGMKLFEELGFTPRLSRKPNETLIYFRNSSAIEDFFANAGMNTTVFALMNAKIQGEIRNNANRIANCETNNIGKAVSASMDVISVIEELDAKGLLSQLPDELETTARARMEYKHLSLSQLAATITPPITKSGLSHRLKKIAEIAEGLIKKKTN